jgi:RND family efflux transporter MFP subunit
MPENGRGPTPSSASTDPGSDGHAPGLRGPAIAPEHAGPTNLPRVSTGGVVAILVVVAIGFAAMFFAGWIPHTRRMEAASAEAARSENEVPVVELVSPRQAPAEETLLLPADLGANQTTAVDARVTGDLDPLPAGIDIGARVSKGQVIATISAPDMDAQLAQARASAEQARAAVKRAEEEHRLAETTLRRFEDPTLGNAISQQDLDVKRSQERTTAAVLDEARINVTVADAAVKHLEELDAFKTIEAPFAGVITSRGFDAGALVSANDAGANKALFVIQQIDPIRARVNVPQSAATEVRVGQSAEVRVANFPGRAFPGTVARTASAIDPATRTLRIEVDVPNASGELVAGMYGQARLNITREHPTLIIPSSALESGSDGERVATVENDAIKLVRVTLGRDYGAEVEVLTGLAPSDRIVKNPGTLADGMRVSVRKP